MIDGNIYIEDLVNDHPELIAPLAERGIVCVACGEPIWGTLGELISSKDIKNPEEIYSKINNIVAEKNAE